MPTRNVVLTQHQAEMIDRLVAAGRYQNASEVLRNGLRLVEREEAEAKARLQALREAARIGMADVQDGRVTVLDSDDELRRHFEDLIASEIGPVRARRRK